MAWLRSVASIGPWLSRGDEMVGRTAGIRVSRAGAMCVLVALAVPAAMLGIAAPAGAFVDCAHPPEYPLAPWLGTWYSSQVMQGGVSSADLYGTGSTVGGTIHFFSNQGIVFPGNTEIGTRTGCDFTARVDTGSPDPRVTMAGTLDQNGVEMGGTFLVESNTGTTYSGSWRSALVGDSASGDVGAGEELSTDPSHLGPSASHRLQTTVLSPTAGTVEIEEAFSSGGTFGTYSLLGTVAHISAPAGTVGSPLQLTFDIDGSATGGHTAADIVVFRNGTAVPPCTGAPQAIPDPCVSSRVNLAGGDVRITVLTSAASGWDFGVRATGPVASVGDVKVREGNRGSKKAKFFVTLSAKSSSTVTVAYTTRAGSAGAASDFVKTSGTLTFRPNKTKLKVRVPIVGDRVHEPTERFVLQISKPTNARLGRDLGIGTVQDND